MLEVNSIIIIKLKKKNAFYASFLPAKTNKRKKIWTTISKQQGQHHYLRPYLKFQFGLYPLHSFLSLSFASTNRQFLRCCLVKRRSTENFTLGMVQKDLHHNGHQVMVKMLMSVNLHSHALTKQLLKDIRSVNRQILNKRLAGFNSLKWKWDHTEVSKKF